MTKYQIQFEYPNGNWSYIHFESLEEESKDMAIKKANDYITDRLEQSEDKKYSIFYVPYKPPKTICVVEYDNDKKTPKRWGKKFKLTLNYLKAKLRNWIIKTDYWYN